MPSTLLTLRAEEREQLSILFLAKYATVAPGTPPACATSDASVIQYNSELAHILDQLGAQVLRSADAMDVMSKTLNSNYVFSIYNRAPFRNSEIFVSALCEYRRIAYLGARPHIRAIAEDKHLSKIVARHLGIPTPEWAVYSPERRPSEPPWFPGPYFVKPRFGAASEGITIDSLQDSWDGILRVAGPLLSSGHEVIVEEFIPGTNYTQPILGATPFMVLPSVENRSTLPGAIITYKQKRLLEPGISRHVSTDGKISAQLADYALRIADHVSPIDYLRVDYRVTADDRIYFLEFNVCCNLGSHSTIAIPAAYIGIGQRALVEHILTYSFRRQSRVRT